MSTRSVQEEVLAANVELAAHGLAHASFGNASGVDRDASVVAIKPSGVPYDRLRVDDVSLVSLETGELLAGLRPSSDTPTHLELYRAFGAAITATRPSPVRNGTETGAEQRSSRPCPPSSRKRRRHFEAVRTLTPAASAAAASVQPSRSTRSTARRRLWGRSSR